MHAPNEARNAMHQSAYLLAFFLLVLSILTIEFCRREIKSRRPDRRSYLFAGKTALDSIASNLGSTFSATYLLGAAIVLTQLVGWWAAATVVVVCVSSYWLYRRLLRNIHSELGEVHCSQQKGNLLLDLYGKSRGRRGQQSLAALYSVIYFGLLVEELAVSRAILSSLVPHQPVVPSAVLLILCAVVIVYVYVGGFRAVLTSDLIQGIVLAAFVAMLVLSSLRSEGEAVTSAVFRNAPDFSDIFPCLVIALVFGISWFVAGVDFASRLNFQVSSTQSLEREQRSVVRISFLGTAALLLAAVVFGEFSRSDLALTADSAVYVDNLARYFVYDSAPLVQVTFIASLLCMIFTTIDTLIITMLQASDYAVLRAARRESIVSVVTAAMAVALVVPVDHLYLFGLMAGSLLILPMMSIVPILAPSLASAVPESNAFAWVALGGTWAVYICFGDVLATSTEIQFLSPGIPLLLGLCTLVMDRLVKSSVGST